MVILKKHGKEFGNIALAAHNRGYKVNYFQDLKKLEIGDEIYYSYKNIKRRFCQMKIKSTTSKTSVTALLGSLKD